MSFVCQYPVPHIVSVLFTFQAAEQGGKLCLVNQPIVQCNGYINLVKGAIYCAHQGASLHQHVTGSTADMTGSTADMITKLLASVCHTRTHIVYM